MVRQTERLSNQLAERFARVPFRKLYLIKCVRCEKQPSLTDSISNLSLINRRNNKIYSVNNLAG